VSPVATTYDRLPELAAERAGIERQIAADDEVLEAAEKEHERVIHPLCFRMQDIREATSEAEKAERELWGTCTDPTLLRPVGRCSIAADEATPGCERLAVADQPVARPGKGRSCRVGSPKDIIGGDREAEVRLERAKGHERKAAECEAALTKVNRTITGLPE